MPDPSPLNLAHGDRWPYPRREYVIRILWKIVHLSLWQICWGRIRLLRCFILRLFGARTPSTNFFARTVRITRPWDLSIGEDCAVGERTHLYNLGGLSIGNQTLISQDVYICGGTHDYTQPTYPLVRKKITIGNYVWIAAGAFIGPGVTIGDGAVIGARAVVMRDVEPWTVVAGNPARFIKKREIQTSSQTNSQPAASVP